MRVFLVSKFQHAWTFHTRGGGKQNRETRLKNVTADNVCNDWLRRITIIVKKRDGTGLKHTPAGSLNAKKKKYFATPMREN